ncbi:hypothetical protein [[Lactobacillus] timonensis]|jgi:flagellar biosynthesis/type III secretory pathway protein FliH|uniref:hypothetical protein n=1 Tax=[Lactobacillus] timonensis TaxID=1970790 RepID=UPI000C84BB6C|nr:hypothetical protein [[Lactobacillus] timonensis]
MDFETKLLERQQLGFKQGFKKGLQQGRQQALVNNIIKQLKAIGYNSKDAYSFVKKLKSVD